MKERKRRRLNPNTVLVIRQIIMGILIFGFIGMVVSSIWYGSRISALTITEVTVSGGETIPHENVTRIVEQQLEGTYLGIVPRRFAPLYPQKDITAEILTIERIKSLTLDRVGGKTLNITFEEYVPAALWCSESSDSCTFLDETGYSFASAPDLTGGSFLRLKKVGIEPFARTQAFSTEAYVRIHTLVSLLENNEWFVSAVDVDAADDMYLQIVEGGELKVTLSDEPETVVNNLLTILSSSEFTHVKPGNFEYIDLRFGNKVFVSEVKIEEEVASSTDEVIVEEDIQ